jgi:hypothetical protein
MSDETPKDEDFTELKPGQGGWTPPVWAPYAAGAGATALGSIGAALLALPEPTMITKVFGIVLLGLAAGLGTAAGVTSAGPRKAGGK